MSSSVPVGAQQQTLPYPGTFYQFDPCLFYGQNTELDLDQAENLDLVENRLYALMKLPSTVLRMHDGHETTFCKSDLPQEMVMDIFMLPWYNHERNTGQSFWSRFCWQTQCISSEYKTHQFQRSIHQR
jgi:hypothetical protein